MKPGRVYLVGAGPGAADLLTVRAARLLAEADVVFHDALVQTDILDLCPANRISVGKRCGRHSTAQRFINKRLLEAAKRYSKVVRLKGGDPMLFGRAQEEISFLTRNGVSVEVVPGITAALAASAQLGLSLTQRGVSRSVAFVTPRAGEGEKPSSWARAAAAADTAVLYMAAGDAVAVREALLAAGMRADTPVAIARDVSLHGSQVTAGALARLPELCPPAAGATLILLGDVFAALQAAASRDLAPRTASQTA